MVDFVSEPRVWETSDSTGSGNLDLSGPSVAISGLRSFVGAGLESNKVPFMVSHQSLDEWEFGLGVPSGGSPDFLSRDSVFRSSQSDQEVNFSSGTKDVFLFDYSGFGGGAIHGLTGATTLDIEHHTLVLNSASTFTVTLPSVSTFFGKEYVFRNINSGTVTISEASGDSNSIEGSASVDVIEDTTLILKSDGTRWIILSRDGHGSSQYLLADGSRNVTGNLSFVKSGASITNTYDSGKASGLIASLQFRGQDSGGNGTIYVSFNSSVDDATDGSETGKYDLRALVDGSFRSIIGFTNDEIVFNDDGVTVNSRFESSGNANMVFVDGTNDVVGIGTDSPDSSKAMDINGKLNVQAIGDNALRVIGDNFVAWAAESYRDGIEHAIFQGRAARGTEASPSAVQSGDSILLIDGRGHDGSGFGVQDARIRMRAAQNFTSTNHGTKIEFETTDNGTTTADLRATIEEDGGFFMQGASGGSQGAGTGNFTAAYDDGSLLTPYVFDAELDGQIDLDRLDSKVPPRVYRNLNGTETVVERDHQPARRFQERMSRDLDPKAFADYWKANRHLPALPSDSEWEEAGNFSTGDLLQRLMETVEVMAIHDDKLRKRIEALEAAA